MSILQLKQRPSCSLSFNLTGSDGSDGSAGWERGRLDLSRVIAEDSLQYTCYLLEQVSCVDALTLNCESRYCRVQTLLLGSREDDSRFSGFDTGCSVVCTLHTGPLNPPTFCSHGPFHRHHVRAERKRLTDDPDELYSLYHDVVGYYFYTTRLT